MFPCAKHPANHLAVQRILARAAFFNHEPIMQQSMLAAAQSLSHVARSAPDIAARHSQPKRGGCRTQGGQRKPLPCYYVRPRSIQGVGEGCARIASEAGATLAQHPLAGALATANGNDGATTTRSEVEVDCLPGLRSLGHMMNFDEIAAIGDRVRCALENTFGKDQLLFSPIGAHRRGKPFHSSVELLVSHTSVIRARQGELLGFAERAVRALELASLVDRKPVKWISSSACTPLRSKTSPTPSAPLLLGSGGCVTDLSGAFVRAHCRFKAHISATEGRLPQLAVEMDVDRLRALRRPLLLQFTTCDRFVPQQFLLTGCDAFVRAVVHRPPRLRDEEGQYPRSRSAPPHAGPIHSAAPDEMVSTTRWSSSSSSSSSWNSMQLSLQGAYSCGTYLTLPSEAALFSRLNLPYIHPFNRYLMDEVPLELFRSPRRN